MVSPRVICFDLGGVLAHVAHTWAEACEDASVPFNLSADIALGEAPPFEPYQAGQIDTETYVCELAAYLQLSHEEARKAHLHILLKPTLATGEIVNALNQTELLTSCLSNTNELHWPELTGPRFPNIEALKLKVASQNLGVSKPDIAIFRKFEEITGTEAGEILFFEDTLINIEGARQAGWNVVAINPREPQADQIRAGLAAYGLTA